jgi:hypothetical protein
MVVEVAAVAVAAAVVVVAVVETVVAAAAVAVVELAELLAVRLVAADADAGDTAAEAVATLVVSGRPMVPVAVAVDDNRVEAYPTHHSEAVLAAWAAQTQASIVSLLLVLGTYFPPAFLVLQLVGAIVFGLFGATEEFSKIRAVLVAVA